MSKKSRKSKVESPSGKKASGLNFRNLGILAGVIVVIFVGAYLFKGRASTTIKDSVMAQAKNNVANQEIDLAIRHLDRFLGDHPDDIDALEMKADLLSKSASSVERILEATKVHDNLIRIDPDGKNRLATRRRLIELYLTYGELVRNYADDQNNNQLAVNESRYLAAVQAADQLIHYKVPSPTDPNNLVENGAIDPSAHRLKAMALMGQVPGLVVKKPEDVQTLGEAKVELEKAIQMDPQEILASEKLAELYLINAKDNATAKKVLDQALTSVQNKKYATPEEANKAILAVRLARFRAFYRTKQKDYLVAAQEELNAAMKLAPDEVDLRTTAAGLALQLNQSENCRYLLDQIPKSHENDLRVRFLRGALEFSERHPEEAIDQWRKGLTLVGGSDLDLTWKLASNLIQINRLVEADPLVKQYLRLSKPNDPLGIYLEGMQAEKEGYINKAIEYMSKASTLVPMNFRSDVLMSLGHAYELKGEEKSAIFAYKQALDLGGAATGPRRSLARLFLSSDPNRSIQLLEEAYSSSKAFAAKQDPKFDGKKIYYGDVNVLIDLIRIKLDRQTKLAKSERDFREIAALLEEAKVIAPDNPVFQGLMAQYLSLDNKVDLAIKTLESTVKGVNKTRPESWLALAEAYEILGKDQEAINVLDKAVAPDAAGDRSAIRSMKARILLRMGLGSRAEEVLTTNLNSVAKSERPDLTRALGDLLQELGKRAAAREAYIRWAEEAPESPFPALKLLSIAQIEGDDLAAEAGLAAMIKLNRDGEPYGLAAQALQLLRTNPEKPGPPSKEKIEKAKLLVQKLNTKAPDFPVKFMVEGMIAEVEADPADPVKWKECLTRSAEAYRKSIKPGTVSPALPKLIEIYMRLKDNDQLNLLKVEYNDGSQRQKTEIAMEFDRLATIIAMKLGDKDRAESNLVRMTENRPDNRQYRFALSTVLESRGKFDEADNALFDLIKVKPDDPVVWLELIRFRARHRSPAEVARTIDMARQKYTAERPELFAAQCFWFGNDIPGAIREFKKAVDARPDDLITLRSLIEFRDATNQRDQVYPVLRKILKLDPTSTWASRNLAMRLTEKVDPATWAEAWSLVAPGSPGTSDRPEDRLIQATVMARSLDVTKRGDAIQMFAALANDLPVSNPIGIEARERLAQAMLESDHPVEAWTYISPICDDLTRSNARSIAIGVEALARMGKGDEANRRFNRLNTLIPDSKQIPISKAWVLSAQGKKEGAATTILETYDKTENEPEGEAMGNALLDLLLKFNNLDAAKVIAVKMKNKWPRQIRNLARVQLARAEYDDVLKSCQETLDQGMPRDAVQSATAAAIARRGDKSFLKKVEDLCLAASKKDSNAYSILICLATIYHMEDEYAKEVDFYRIALKQQPDNRQFLNNMAWTLSEGLNQPEEAFKLIEELINREGPAPQYLDTRGMILTRLKKYDQAITDLEKSAKIDPSAMTYYHLAKTYYQAKKPDESRRCWNIARSKKIDLDSLDPTDRSDLIEVMGK